jgi:hypothetical protein
VVVELELSEVAGLAIAAGDASAAGMSAAKAGADNAVANRAAERTDRVRFISGISLSWAVVRRPRVSDVLYCDSRATELTQKIAANTPLFLVAPGSAIT